MFNEKRNYTRSAQVNCEVEISEVMEALDLEDLLSAACNQYGVASFAVELADFIEGRYAGGLDAFYRKYKAEK